MNNDQISYCFKKQFNCIPAQLNQEPSEFYLTQNEMMLKLVDFVFSKDLDVYIEFAPQLANFVFTSEQFDLSAPNDTVQCVLRYTDNYADEIVQSMSMQQRANIVGQYLVLESLQSTMLYLAYHALPHIEMNPEKVIILLTTFLFVDVQFFARQIYVHISSDNPHVRLFCAQTALYIQQECESQIQQRPVFSPVCIAKFNKRYEIPTLSEFLSLQDLKQMSIEFNQLNTLKTIAEVMNQHPASAGDLSMVDGTRVLLTDFRPENDSFLQFFNPVSTVRTTELLTQNGAPQFDQIELINFIFKTKTSALDYKFPLQMESCDLSEELSEVADLAVHQTEFVNDQFQISITGQTEKPESHEAEIAFILAAYSHSDIEFQSKINIPVQAIQQFCIEMNISKEKLFQHLKLTEDLYYRAVQTECKTSLIGFSVVAMKLGNQQPSKIFGYLSSFLIHKTERNLWMFANSIILSTLFKKEKHFTQLLQFKVLEYLYCLTDLLHDQYSIVRKIAILNQLALTSQMYKDHLKEQLSLLDNITITKLPYTEDEFDFSIFRAIIKEQFQTPIQNAKMFKELIEKIMNSTSKHKFAAIINNYFIKNFIILKQPIYESDFKQFFVIKKPLIGLNEQNKICALIHPENPVVCKFVVWQLVYSEFDFNAVTNYMNLVQPSRLAFVFLQVLSKKNLKLLRTQSALEEWLSGKQFICQNQQSWETFSGPLQEGETQLLGLEMFVK
ncbi:Hypothetical_protein [Hexamita inflata]|uniref:Hypothetical_protein n=1 Tax=Hexamita inflata TaxID=28002 RepID=A0AA86P3U6_9EUKA|nr:Hypothetical protein HINF_LOCUS17574 [Hexamita inflata]